MNRTKQSADKKITKPQAGRQSRASRASAATPPTGHRRAKPGASGEGEYYHIEIRPSSEFRTFRTQDVGKPGGIERVAGKRSSGSWDTQKWLISKRLAHVENGRLVPDNSDAREILEDLGSAPVRIRGDRFRARPRRNVPEDEKPTAAQRGAQRRNITRAQALAFHRI